MTPLPTVSLELEKYLSVLALLTAINVCWTIASRDTASEDSSPDLPQIHGIVLVSLQWTVDCRLTSSLPNKLELCHT